MFTSCRELQQQTSRRWGYVCVGPLLCGLSLAAAPPGATTQPTSAPEGNAQALEPQALRDLAAQNAGLAQERARLADLIASAEARIATTRREGERLRKELGGLEQAVRSAGLSQVLGARLAVLRADVDKLGGYQRDLRSCGQEAARAELRRAELGDLSASLDLDARTNAIWKQLERTPDFDPARLEPRVQELLSAQGALLESLQGDYDVYTSNMIQLQAEVAALQQHAQQLETFIAERALWLPSTVPLTAVRWPPTATALLATTRSLGQALRSDLQASAWLYGSIVLALLLLIALQPRAARALQLLAEQVRSPETDSFGLTLKALAWTAFLAIPGPAILWAIGARLVAAAEAGDADVYALARALRYGLGGAALLWFSQGLLRQICRPAGLGEAHFRWNRRALGIAHRETLWAIAVMAPATLLTAISEHYRGPWRDSLGRLTFIVGMSALAVFLLRILRPSRGVLTEWLLTHRRQWIFRMRHVLYGVAIAVPSAMAILSAIGYHYTALALGQRLTIRTYWLILGVLIGNALLVRWLSVAQRTLAAAEVATSAAANHEGDLGRLSDQTRSLLRSLVAFVLAVGLWAIWVDMAPALRFVGDVHLWSYTVDSATAADAGGATAATLVRYITLSDLVLALVVALVTAALAHNLPGLLEIVLLRRLALDAGARFAITAMARYFVVIVGIILACGAVGVSWSRVQWLAAAVTVGLGFGLQEIFANFVSGLMLLFERPIRIGDIVTVGSISGTVTRIHIRATTIVDWDCKELIIPNKQFITGQIINWTLSSSTLRIVVPVRIVHGSNVELAEELLLTVAGTTAHVLKDPVPTAVFVRIGEGTLDFELRVYIADVNHSVEVQHNLNTAIHREFQQAGIEIACPQRDVRLRASDGLPLAIAHTSDVDNRSSH